MTDRGTVNHFVIEPQGVEALIRALADSGYRVIGPRLERGAVRLRPIGGAADLPRRVRDEQAPGRYRTDESGAEWFGYAVGPSSLKEWLFPPQRTVWTAEQTETGWTFHRPPAPSEAVAVFGVRPCDLAAVAVQDRVLLDGPHVDPDYAARRERLFIVAVNCTRPAATCFCASMGTGPAVSPGSAGHDLALTERVESDRHWFVGSVGTEAGARLLHGLEHRAATPEELDDVEQALAGAATRQTRALETTGLPEWITGEANHPGWETVAERCLACTNCTLVCPTCFCVSTEPTSTLDGQSATLDRRWDSCFSLDFSFMGGRPVRSSIAGRYRQWLTHKLGTWQAQFGTLGCVGCGRCITWCPAGIDLTAEVAAMRGDGDA